jgi:hypothetical protein
MVPGGSSERNNALYTAPSEEHFHSTENCLVQDGAGLPKSLQSKTKWHSRFPEHADLTH